MKTDKVKRLSPESRFFYWIRERHNVWNRRQVGQKKPWTDDEVLQQYFFTNPYRENDKTTVWFREKIREPFRECYEVLFATVAFRWFNRIETGEALLATESEDGFSILVLWNRKRALATLRRLKNPFTGAFMIPAVPGTKKIEHVCDCLKPFWKDRLDLASEIEEGQSLEKAHKLLTLYPYMGDFMAYEVVTDLRHTILLDQATDINTWANPGPGCRRGLKRLLGLPLKKSNAAGVPKVKNELKLMRRLLAKSRNRLAGLPPLEMREIEHSLCEWDKYERALWGDGGRMKRRYPGLC